MSERFLSRWARRKREQAVEQPAENPAGTTLPADARGEQDPRSPAPPGEAALRSGTGAAGEAPRLEARIDGGHPAEPGAPELPPVESLTPESDFRPFLRDGVPPATRSAALKKLFADPAFNVMDGLDVYIEDFGKTEPVPESLLKGLAQSRLLGLVGEPEQAGGQAAEPVAGQAAGQTAGAPRQPAVPQAAGEGAVPANTQAAESSQQAAQGLHDAEDSRSALPPDPISPKP